MIGRPPQQSKTELGQRLASVRGKETRDSFALKTEISTRSLGSYERGDSVPDANFLAKLVEIYDVDLNWLICGTSQQPKQIKEIDPDALAEILRAVLDWKERRNAELDQEQIASLIATFYENLISKAGESAGNESDTVSRN